MSWGTQLPYFDIFHLHLHCGLGSGVEVKTKKIVSYRRKVSTHDPSLI